MEPVDLFAIVLLLAVLIGCVNYFWAGLPPAIGMLLGSLVVSLLYVGSDRLFHLHAMHWLRDTLDEADLPHFFLDGTLALLLFAGSLHVDVVELSRRRWLILLLATASVVISTAVFGYGIYLTFGLTGAVVPLAWCLVLGAVLAPTDAVVVENLLQRSGLPPNLRAAVVGESLFNDGAGVVLFLLALGVTQRAGHPPDGAGPAAFHRLDRRLHPVTTGEVMAMALRVVSRVPVRPVLRCAGAAPLPAVRLTPARQSVVAVLARGRASAGAAIWLREAGVSAAVLRGMVNSGLLVAGTASAGGSVRAARSAHPGPGLSAQQEEVAAVLREAVDAAPFPSPCWTASPAPARPRSIWKPSPPAFAPAVRRW